MEKWECPSCYAPVEALGPSLLRLEIAAHIRAHERAAARRAVADCGETCHGLMGSPKFCAARQPNDKGLTPFDERFLDTAKVLWDAPFSKDEIK